MAVSQSISNLLDGVRQAYIDDQISKGIRSSGKSASSLRTEITNNSGILFGAGYFYQQKHGRKPGKFPPIDDILEWIRAKGIQPTDIPERSLAFLIARKIANKGTDIFQGRREGINVDDKIRTLVEQFKKEFAGDFKAEIIKALK